MKRITIFFPLLLVFFLLTALFIVSADRVLAAEEIMVSPTRIENLVTPGQAIAESVKVTNNSISPKKISVYLRDFTAEGEEGKAKLIVPGTVEGSFLSSWIKLIDQSFDFAPGEEKEFKFTIDVPKETGPGGYYGALVFGTVAPDVNINSPDKGAAMAFSQQVASLVLLQIAGNAQEVAVIREFATDKKVYSAPFNVTFIARIENLGNVHLKPHGTIEISDLLGRPVKTIIVNDNGANVLPKSIRRFAIPWQGNFAFGRYKAQMALSYGTPAESGGTGVQSLDAVNYFWILPGKLITFSGLGLILLFVVIYLFLRLLKKRAVSKAMKEMGISKQSYDNAKKFKQPSSKLHIWLITIILIIIIILLAGAWFLLK